MSNIKIIDAILNINPKAEVSTTNEDYDTIQWHNGTTPIAKSDIEAKVSEMNTAYDNAQYQRDRAVAYPSLNEFAEAYCEKEIGGNSTKWNEYVTKYNKVRTDNPKE